MLVSKNFICSRLLKNALSCRLLITSYDISFFRIVSAVQAMFSCIAGFFVCRWSCPRNFLQASHFLSESYAWFAASYFFYDIWSMYKVYAAEASNKLKATLGLMVMNGNGAVRAAANVEKSSNPNLSNSDESSSIQALEDIPSISNGTLSILLSSKLGTPSFARYLISHKLMVFHHLFIGSYGLAVISVSSARLKKCNLRI